MDFNYIQTDLTVYLVTQYNFYFIGFKGLGIKVCANLSSPR